MVEVEQRVKGTSSGRSRCGARPARTATSRCRATSRSGSSSRGRPTAPGWRLRAASSTRVSSSSRAENPAAARSRSRSGSSISRRPRSGRSGGCERARVPIFRAHRSPSRRYPSSHSTCAFEQYSWSAQGRSAAASRRSWRLRPARVSPRRASRRRRPNARSDEKSLASSRRREAPQPRRSSRACRVDEIVSADLLIEAVVEDMESEEGDLPACRRDPSIRRDVASNTSSIPIASLAAVTERPEKVIGMHFFNPVPVLSCQVIPRPKPPTRRLRRSSRSAEDSARLRGGERLAGLRLEPHTHADPLRGGVRAHGGGRGGRGDRHDREARLRTSAGPLRSRTSSASTRPSRSWRSSTRAGDSEYAPCPLFRRHFAAGASAGRRAEASTSTRDRRQAARGRAARPRDSTRTPDSSMPHTASCSPDTTGRPGPGR